MCDIPGTITRLSVAGQCTRGQLALTSVYIVFFTKKRACLRYLPLRYDILSNFREITLRIKLFSFDFTLTLLAGLVHSLRLAWAFSVFVSFAFRCVH